jgi:hypothetical protein
MNVVVESEAAYRYGKSLFQGKTVTWHTTSPWLMEKLPEIGESIFSLEFGLLPEETHEIGETAVLLADGIARFIDRRIKDLPSGMRAGIALGEVLFRGYAALYYKAWLLERLMRRTGRGREEVYIIGDTDLPTVKNFVVLLPRNANLFSVLASYCEEGNAQTLLFKEEDWEGVVNKRLVALGTSRWERAMNAANMPATTLVFKVYKYWKATRRMGRHPGKEDVYILKSNPLIEEAFIPLRLKGVRVRFLPSLPLSDAAQDESITLGAFYEQCRPILSRSGLIDHDGPFLKAATKLAISLTMEALRFARSQAWSVEDFVNREIGDRDIKNKVVWTNALSQPAEVMFYYGCKKRRLPVFLVSHGVSAGLSRYHGRVRKVMSFSRGDVFVAYSKGECHPEMDYVIAGAPCSERSLRGKRIQRHFARAHLHVPSGKRMIMYVANLYSNNAVDLPYGGTNDYFQHCLKKTIIEGILNKLTDHCIAKLYPTQRYADPDPFVAQGKSSGVVVAQWKEFRYLRSACDVILVDMVQSAFGWAWSTGVPLVLLTTPYYPLLPDVEKDLKKAIFVVSTETARWDQELLSLLQLPRGELERMWREKERARLRTEIERIMGPRVGLGTALVRATLAAKMGNRTNIGNVFS